MNNLVIQRKDVIPFLDQLVDVEIIINNEVGIVTGYVDYYQGNYFNLDGNCIFYDQVKSIRLNEVTK